MHTIELVRHLVTTDPVGHAAADDVELALEILGIGDVHAFSDEELLDAWLVATRGFAEDLAFYWNRAPAEECLALVGDDVLENLHRRLALAWVWRKKYHARSIITFRWQFDPLLGHFLAEKLVRHLD